MTEPRLVATDLDGTLLNAEGVISELNQRALREAADRGIEVVVATGRPWRWLQVLEPLHDLDLHVLTSNGAVRYDLHGGVVTSHDSLDVDVVAEVIDDLRGADSRLGFALEHVDGWSCDEVYLAHSTVAVPGATVRPIDEALNVSPAVKLLVRSADLPSDRLAELLAPLIGDRLTPTWSFVVSPGLLEISSPGVTKASGLQRVLDDLDIAAAEAVAFGDMPNDIAMLQLVGRGFVMSNAHPSLHELGLPVAGDHDDSGVGRTLLGLLGHDY
ncbi:HAD family hydrolase [Aestuariimicrobium kwangyangense]|uniref:HAD family hydrolase n=1 Tax=Aestuariimicrobium kwangyangense TaxID=396389 RepID=UPI0004189127|nr:HAD family hydrolase [Aestuariimicrobium kwangyangense]